MCGICGFICAPQQHKLQEKFSVSQTPWSKPPYCQSSSQTQINPADKQSRHTVLERMTDRITHRGPDDCGYFEDDYISMGFRRLSIIDLEAGHQPLFNHDKTKVLSFNGEIYNYRELREELISLGYEFQTQSDSEVLIHGYEAWGSDLLEKLRGMWGFAIYDTKERRLFIARDRFGIKPIYFAQLDQHFIYASEIKSILEHPGYRKEFNHAALDQYLSFQYCPGPETFFKGIYCLMPGHYLIHQEGSFTITRYWEAEFTPDETLSEQEAVERIDQTFCASVEAHRVADVEVGCFLSSGIDSSYVASQFSGMHSFSVGFDFGERYNETSWAEELSRHIKTQQHSKLISSEEFWDAVPQVQYYLDQPLADPSAIALYFVSQEAAKQVKVVLSGEGADELFGGYTIYHEPIDRAAYQKKLPLCLRKFLATCAAKLPEGTKGRAFLLRGARTIEESFIGNAFMFNQQEKRELLKDSALASSPHELCAPYYQAVKHYGDKTISKMQYLDINLWMVGDILLKADRMSMAHSLELRVPFLDKEVFELARIIPETLRIKKGQTKYALRKAAERHIPEKWAQKRKLGFPVPTRIWLKDDKYYQKVKNIFESETAKKFFNSEVLLSYLDTHKSGKLDTSRKVWTAYSFLLWYQIYFEDRPLKLS